MDLYILNKNEEIVTTLSGTADNSACHFFNGKLTKELNKGASLSFDIVTSELGEDALHITEENLVIVNLDGEFKLFIIKEIQDTHEDTQTRSVYCECASIELADEIMQQELSGSKLEATDALAKLLIGTRWKVGQAEDTYIRTLSEPYQWNTVLNGVTTLVSEYDMEYDATVTILGNKITGRYINIKKAFGRTLGKRFEYSKDLTSITRTVNTGDIKTAVLPLGKEIEDESEVDGEETRSTGKVGERLTIEYIEWTTPSNPRNKPLGQLYLEDTDATALWGYVNPDGTRRPRIMPLDYSECTDATELIKYAEMQLARFTSPKISYEATVIDLYKATGDPDYSFETVKLGDLVNIIDHEFTPALILTSRIVSIEYDLNNPHETMITLGTIVPSIVDKDFKTQLQELNFKVSASASSSDVSGLTNRVDDLEYNVQSGRWETINEINNLLFGETLGYVYMQGDNGLWVYDRPQTNRPTKAVVLKGGQIGLAKYDEQLQTWKVGTFIDGDSVNASMITTGVMSADRIEGGTLKISHFNKELREEFDGKTTVGQVTTLLEASKESIEASVYKKYETKEDAQDKIDGLKIGGTNIVVRYNELEDVCIADGGELTPATGHSTILDYIPVTEGEHLALWKDGVLGEDTTDNNFRWIFLDAEGNQLERKANPSSNLILTAPTGATSFRISYPTASRVKVERGTKSTDFSYSLEDIDNDLSLKANIGQVYTTEEIDEQLASLKVTAEGITSMVSDVFVEKDAYTDEVLDIRDRISLIEQTSTELKMSFETILPSLADGEELDNLVNKVNTHITFNDDGITLGKSDSSFKTVITNERISFTDHGEEVAYISNNKFYILNGEIVEQLILGGFEVRPRSTNGNLSFLWKG